MGTPAEKRFGGPPALGTTMLALAAMAGPGRHCTRCGASFEPDVLYCPRDGQPLTTRRTEIGDDPYLGLSIDGLRLDQLVGLGAMGRVYRARETSIDRDVAVKILHRELIRNPVLVSRFEREARAAARIAHPNVITVYRTGTLPELGPAVGGEAYLVLEYLDGISLRSALAAARGALPLPRALHIVLQICDAVGEAHAQNVVHRDLKPDNVMLVHRGDDTDFVKVLDFGVARFEDTDGELFTQAGAVLGTARYVSPEGASGEPVGAPGDVYSITTMLFECLAGTTPFDGDSPVAILVKQTTERAPDIRSIPRSSYVPAPLAALIAQNLAKDPAARHRDARELGRALVAAAHESGLSAEDLLPRSTLLGTRPMLRWASLERTKAMPLSTAARPGGTALVDPPLVEATLEATHGAERHTATQGGSAPEQDTGATRTSHAELPPAPATPPHRHFASTAPRPSLGDAPARTSLVDATLNEAHAPLTALAPDEERRLALRRGGLILACFATGAVVALLAAKGLGAFEEPQPGPSSYVERARAALARGDLLTPRHENVRDLTDTALGVWPRHPELVATRKEAAERLLTEARTLPKARRERALWLLTAALELDPDSPEIRELFAELSAPPSPPSPAPSAPSSAPRQAPKLERRPVAQPALAPPSSAAPPPAPPPEAPNVNVGAEPVPSSERWL